MLGPGEFSEIILFTVKTVSNYLSFLGKLWVHCLKASSFVEHKTLTHPTYDPHDAVLKEFNKICHAWLPRTLVYIIHEPTRSWDLWIHHPAIGTTASCGGLQI